jgi:multidrug transporter EmrE-like cation transporter
MLRFIALCYSAGSFAAFLSSLAMHLGASGGLHRAFGLALRPGFDTNWLFPRIVWGGLVGMLFAFPLPLRFSWIGLFAITVALTCLQLFVVYPIWEGMGYLGLRYGWAMPFFCFGYTAIYVIGTSLSLRLFGGR